jgi:light-harvesting complex I chlorophyll a/b binding protein 1
MPRLLSQAMLLFVSTATAARPSSSWILHQHFNQGSSAFSFFSKKRKAPIYISEELGLSPTFQYQFFDPLNLATEENFAFYREAELKHCRIAMLSMLGNSPLPNVLRSLIPNSDSLMLSPSHHVALDDVPLGLGALNVVPILGWFQIVFFIGILETQIFIQKDPKDMPGDYGTGYFGLRDKGRHLRSLQCELENGRLAMIAFVVQIISELMTGETVDKQIEYLYKWIIVH